jgi:uncharacterized protein (DUF1499 family)
MNEKNKPVHKNSRARRVMTALIVIGLIPVVFLATRSVMSSRPDNLGATDGRLAGCPDSPNCVSTEATDDEHSVELLTFTDSADDAMNRLKRVIENWPRATIVTSSESYLHAEFTTLIFRYTDDVEFQINAEQNTIQIRSASRTGYSDLGANRTRVELIRTAFESTTTHRP